MEKPIFEYVSSVNYIAKRVEIEKKLKEIQLFGEDELIYDIGIVLQQIENHHLLDKPTTDMSISMSIILQRMEIIFKRIYKHKSKYPELVENISLLFADFWLKIISVYFNLSSNPKSQTYILSLMVALNNIPSHLNFLLSFEFDYILKEYIANIKDILAVFHDKMDKELKALKAARERR